MSCHSRPAFFHLCSTHPTRLEAAPPEAHSEAAAVVRLEVIPQNRLGNLNVALVGFSFVSPPFPAPSLFHVGLLFLLPRWLLPLPLTQ